MQQKEEIKILASEKGNVVSLDSPGVAKAVSKRVLEDIDNYCVRTYDGGHRKHLGGSAIGDPCKRKLWYVFRWCFREETDGRKQRLFNRGHREEERFIEWLEGIGAKVYAWKKPPIYDSSGKIIEEGEQYRVSAVMGHFGGSLDSIIILPERYRINEPVLGEFKTNKTGAAFNKLCEEGMSIHKPQHWTQTCTYGSDPNYNLKYCLYFCINKNDDSLHVEIVKLDHKLGRNMRLKAEQIILSQVAPIRLSDNPTYRECTWCGAFEICHKGALPECNCRSCINAFPVENKQWLCSFYNSIIPEDFISKACEKYFSITLNKNG